MTSFSSQGGCRPAAFVGHEREFSELNVILADVGAKPASSVGLERKGRDALLEVRSRKSGPGEILRGMRLAIHPSLPLLQYREFSVREVLHRVCKASRECGWRIAAQCRELPDPCRRSP